MEVGSDATTNLAISFILSFLNCMHSHFENQRMTLPTWYVGINTATINSVYLRKFASPSTENVFLVFALWFVTTVAF